MGGSFLKYRNMGPCCSARKSKRKVSPSHAWKTSNSKNVPNEFLFGSKSNTKTLVVEQPELDLHPALEAKFNAHLY